MPRIFLRRPLILTDNENELSIFVRNALRWVVISRTEKIWTESHASTCFYILSSLLAAAPRQSNYYSLSLVLQKHDPHRRWQTASTGVLLLHGVHLLIERQRPPQAAWPPQPGGTTSSKAAVSLLHPGGATSSKQRHRFFNPEVRPQPSGSVTSSKAVVAWPGRSRRGAAAHPGCGLRSVGSDVGSRVFFILKIDFFYAGWHE
jgi:hypothetical protein